eukprot:3441194-Prymnesium_polylepis.1
MTYVVERQLSVMRAATHCKVAQVLPVTPEVRHAKSIRSVPAAPAGVPQKGTIRREADVHKHRRLAQLAAGQQLVCLVDAGEVGQRVLEPHTQHEIVLRRLVLVVVDPLADVGGRLVEEVGAAGDRVDDDALAHAVAENVDDVRLLLGAG